MTPTSAALLAAFASAVAASDMQPPRARIDFPLGSALTDAESIRVRGATRDASGVTAVRVNGVLASTADGFAHWWTNVPLSLGENTIVVETLDTLGNLDTAAASTVVRRDGVIVRRPQGLALDPSSGTCFIFDWLPDGSTAGSRTRIVAADLATGALEVVSSRSQGSGPLPRYATGEMEYDPVGGRLILIDVSAETLLGVDTTTGDRSVLSGGGVGGGPPLQGAVGLELDPEHGRAWVFNQSFGPSSGALLRVDLASGNRQVVSSPVVGSGPWPQHQRWMTRVGSGQRLLVTCFISNLVLGIDLETGKRSIVSNASSGLGTPWSNVWGVAAVPDGRAWVGSVGDGRLFALDVASGVHAEVAVPPVDDPGEIFDLKLDLAHGRLLAADDLRAAILARNLAGGELEIFLRNSIGGGTPFRRSLVRGIAVDQSGRAWMVDHEMGELIAVGLADGVRTLKSGGGQGSGPDFIQPVDVELDDSIGAARALVLDAGLVAVVAVDLASGARSIVSGAGVGAGPALQLDSWAFVSMDLAGGRVWVMDSAQIFANRLLAVDLATGDRTLVSGDGVGSGPDLYDSVDVAVDLASARALTFAQGDLVAIDLATGDRSVLSSEQVGSGPTFGAPVLLDWDATQQRALVYGWYAGVTAVDGTTGDRVRLAVSDGGKGPGLAWPLSMDLWRPLNGGEPILLMGDHELTALSALDLAVDAATGEVPAWRAIVSR